MKRLLLFINTLLPVIINAQVNENLLMERFNMNAFNPAYAGSEGRVLSFTTRSTWQGVNDAPKMNYFYFSGNPKNNLSFGLLENGISIRFLGSSTQEARQNFFWIWTKLRIESGFLKPKYEGVWPLQDNI